MKYINFALLFLSLVAVACGEQSNPHKLLRLLEDDKLEELEKLRRGFVSKRKAFQFCKKALNKNKKKRRCKSCTRTCTEGEGCSRDCKFVECPESALLGEEAPLREDKSTSAKNGTIPRKKIQNVLNTLEMFCTDDLQKCAETVQDNKKVACPALFVKTCKQCFGVGRKSYVDSACLCQCGKDNKETIAECAKDDKRLLGEAFPNDVSADHALRMLNKKNGLDKADQLKFYWVAKFLKGAKKCLKRTWDTASDVCKDAIEDLWIHHNETSTEDEDIVVIEEEEIDANEDNRRQLASASSLDVIDAAEAEYMNQVDDTTIDSINKDLEGSDASHVIANSVLLVLAASFLQF